MQRIFWLGLVTISLISTPTFAQKSQQMTGSQTCGDSSTSLGMAQSLEDKGQIKGGQVGNMVQICAGDQSITGGGQVGATMEGSGSQFGTSNANCTPIGPKTVGTSTMGQIQGTGVSQIIGAAAACK